MIVPLAHGDWQILRAVLRSASPPVGRSLRLDMSRRTRDGQFLTRLVGLGLLRVVEAAEHPFGRTYSLTPAGEWAAEFGEYELAKGSEVAATPPPLPAPAPKPLTRSA